MSPVATAPTSTDESETHEAPREQDAPLPGSDVPRAGAELAIRHSDVPATFGEMMTLARELADSDILPAHLRRKSANVLAVMFASKALDIPMWTAFQVLHIVEGKVAMDATFQRAMVIRAGHTFRITERSMDRAVAEIVRADDPTRTPQTSEFTWKEAQAAGLDKKNTWQKYRKAMLVARVTTQIIRDVCPEVLFSPGYAPEELDMAVDDGGNPVTVIPSERVAANVTVRTPEEREALRVAYEARIEDAETTAELNLIWADAKDDNVLDAPLRPGVSVKQAMAERARVIKIVAEQNAEETLAGKGFRPVGEDGGTGSRAGATPSTTPAPASAASSASAEVYDAEVVHEETTDPWAEQQQMPLP